MGLPVKYPQIHSQHRQHKDQKASVKPEILPEREQDNVNLRHGGTLAAD
jgi:hypothetical protein